LKPEIYAYSAGRSLWDISPSADTVRLWR
jgi:hypothetical protein